MNIETLSIEDLTGELATGKHDGQLDVLFATERDGKARKGALAALAERALAAIGARREAPPEAPSAAPSEDGLRPECTVLNTTRSPWRLGPLMGTEKDNDGHLVPVLLDETVILVPAVNPKKPQDARVKVNGDLWHKYATSEHLGPTIAGLVKRNEIDVVGYAA